MNDGHQHDHDWRNVEHGPERIEQDTFLNLREMTEKEAAQHGVVGVLLEFVFEEIALQEDAAIDDAESSGIDAVPVFNAAQSLTTNSGGSWLRPTAITGPRILRLGALLNW